MGRTIVVADGDEAIRQAVRARFERQGWLVREAMSAAECQRFAEGGAADAVVLGGALPDAIGLEVLATLKVRDPATPVIVATDRHDVDRAMDALRAGAFACVGRPFDIERLVSLVREATQERERIAPADGNGDGRASERLDVTVESLIGESEPMRRARALIERVASSPSSTVLITGESGTGKDLAARAIHRESSRASGPFMNITCSALPPALLESELFGHERGAFTDARQQKKGLLELANGGTVFLDEIGEMSPPLQAKLLRFLEEKAFRRVGGSADVHPDVRVVAATHVDLGEAVQRGEFRRDLFYRLAVLTVELPALRERPGDIELLVRHFLASAAAERGREVDVSDAAMAALKRHTWPGNVRELRNAIERAVLLTDRPVLEPEDFDVLRKPASRNGNGHRFVLPPEGIVMRDIERDLVVQALERCGGNQTRAAAMLGMNRDQIRYRIAKFGLGRYGRDEELAGGATAGAIGNDGGGID